MKALYLTNLQVGDQVIAKIANEEVTGIITGFGTHKGKPVIDLFTGDDSFIPNRFVYIPQIIAVIEMTPLYSNLN